MTAKPSLEALTWAGQQRTYRPADRLVLLEYAFHANHKTFMAFPSVATIADRSGLDRKTIMASVARLAYAGLLEDTGRKAGKSGRVTIYRLAVKGVKKPAPNPKAEPEVAAAHEARGHWQSPSATIELTDDVPF